MRIASSFECDGTEQASEGEPAVDGVSDVDEKRDADLQRVRNEQDTSDLDRSVFVNVLILAFSLNHALQQTHQGQDSLRCAHTEACNGLCNGEMPPLFAGNLHNNGLEKSVNRIGISTYDKLESHKCPSSTSSTEVLCNVLYSKLTQDLSGTEHSTKSRYVFRPELGFRHSSRSELGDESFVRDDVRRDLVLETYPVSSVLSTPSAN